MMYDQFIIDKVGVLKVGKLYTSMYGSDNPLYSVKLYREGKERTPGGHPRFLWANVRPGSVFVYLGTGDEIHKRAQMLYDGLVWYIHSDSVIGAAKVFKRIGDKNDGS